MLKVINVTKIRTGGNYSFRFDTPKNCPLCKAAYVPSVNEGVITLEEKASVYCYCPNCDSGFIAIYKNIFLSQSSSNLYTASLTNLESCEPNRFLKKSFSDELTVLSPNFIKIYNQALAAESYNLDEIAGIGYRKALEFLIKDFCIKQHPTKKTDIENSLLSNCIKTYLNHYNIQVLAKASVWIGNDETHYVRKHSNKDINDMKNFIDALVYYVNFEIQTKKAIAMTTTP